MLWVIRVDLTRLRVLIRSGDLAERTAGVHRPETIRLPNDVARYIARELINQLPQSGFLSIVQKLTDGQIGFTKRYLPTED